MIKLIHPNKEIEEIKLEDICKGKKIILYFYPKDNTPWCTKEAKDFSVLKEEFKKLGYDIIGVSKDSISSHEKFIEKQNLKIDLISDPELILHKKFGAWGKKKNYWREYEWTIRSTFVLDNCKIIKEYRNVKATWHAERVLKELASY